MWSTNCYSFWSVLVSFLLLNGNIKIKTAALNKTAALKLRWLKFVVCLFRCDNENAPGTEFQHVTKKSAGPPHKLANEHHIKYRISSR